MTDRIIDLSSYGGKVRLENHLLVLEFNEINTVTVPLEDIAVVILDNQQMVITQPALGALGESRIPVVITDRKHMPSSILFPLVGNGKQTEYFMEQIKAPVPVSKKAWKEIIQAKILSQAELLAITRGKDFGLREIAKSVKSGDTTNRESLAAQRYWSEMPFLDRRNRDEADANIYLNYGYTILHAMASRAVCAAGLHPSIGIQHHHRNNPFCLASDVMEPFRAIVDREVWKIWQEEPETTELTRDRKAKLLYALLGKVMVNDERISVFKALSGICVGLRKRFCGLKDASLMLPDGIFVN
ncbi:subtype II CRISPR-associated endonuclease Cas1 [Candidatus Fermentibacteria bacterium]|nr:MAG: subtype II CRISPR-associated endonuclease Cas1 [Candidatus Fermentibacteria bacterium]